MLTFGIIGAGLMGKRRAESLKQFGTKIIAIADADEKRAAELAQQYGCESVADYRKLLKDHRIQCVIVATTNNMLATCTKEAILAGKHVLVEKPAATSLHEINEIATLAAKSGVVVKVGFNHRFLPAIQKARELFSSGAIGDLMFIKATYGQKGRIGFEKEWRAKKNIAGGGELLDQGVHAIDLCRIFLGSVHAQGTVATLFWNTEVEDNAFFTLRSDAGIAQVHVSSSLWRNTFRFEIHGTKGIIIAEGIRGHYGAPKLTLLTRNEQRSNEVGVYQFDESVITFPDEDTSWVAEMENFIAAIEKGAAVEGGVDDAVAALHAVFDLYKQNNI